MKKKKIAWLLCAAMLLGSGCSFQANGKPARKIELTISAAASLSNCMQDLGVLYNKNNPEVTLVFNFGGSGALQQQIEQGAPADVFFSAGKKQMDALLEKGLMEEETVREALENKLVLIAPTTGKQLERFEMLADAQVKKIGVGEPGSVPVGQYAAEVFEHLDMAKALKEKLVFAKDVREVLSWVETGNVQAGIVYKTDAQASTKVIVCCEAPAGSYARAVYPVGVVKATKNKEAAHAFLDFLSTKDAKRILEQYGFTVLLYSNLKND